MKRAEREMGVTFLNLDWVDSTSFEISDESFSDCCRFIHRARSDGGSVLVHCAQVQHLPPSNIHTLTPPPPLSLSLSLSLSRGGQDQLLQSWHT